MIGAVANSGRKRLLAPDRRVRSCPEFFEGTAAMNKLPDLTRGSQPSTAPKKSRQKPRSFEEAEDNVRFRESPSYPEGASDD